MPFYVFSSERGLERLREQGYRISPFRTTLSFQKERSILKGVQRVVIEEALQRVNLSQDTIEAVAGVTVRLLLDQPPSFNFGLLNTKEEYVNLARLVLKVAINHEPVAVVSPVCPDYQGGYHVVGTGIGKTAIRFFDALEDLQEVFSRHSLGVFVEIDVADAEAVDRFLSSKLHILPAALLENAQKTREAIQEEVIRRGLRDVVKVRTMLERCEQCGIDYAERQEFYVNRLFDTMSFRSLKIFKSLIQERVAVGDYQDFSLAPEEFQLAAAYELAGYAVYGELIGANAIIASADAQSAIAGYNVLKKNKNEISPTAFIKPPRKEKYGLFLE